MLPFDFRYIFICPNPNHPYFIWDWQILSVSWDVLLIIIFFMVLIFLVIFYFVFNPDTKANIVFWFSVVILSINGGIIAVLYLKSKNNIFLENHSWNWYHIIITFISGILTTLQVIFILLAVFLILSLIPTTWHIRAMRKYPFKFIP